MTKRALLVGCNYPNSENPLKGCVNDVMRFREVLTSRFEFDKGDIEVLVDTDESSVQPTHNNILASLRELITGAESGDVLVFYFSGHGTRLPPEAGESDETGWDEAICPSDSTNFPINLLTDDDFRELVKLVPSGATFTFLADSCHSGGLIDETKEQIGDAEVVDEPAEVADTAPGITKEIPVEQLTSMLSQRSGHRVEVGNIRTTLFDLFREDASLTVKKFENLVMQQINDEQDEDGLVGTISPLAVQFLQSRLAEDPDNVYLAPTQNAGVYRPRSRRSAAEAADVSILLSGCQSNELSTDRDDPAGAYGAFTKAIETVLSQSDAPLTNREMVLAAREWLESQGFKQHPCLYCSDDNVDVVFICDYAAGAN